MPRAQAQVQEILEKISVVRQSIDVLDKRLHESQQVCDNHSFAFPIYSTLRL